MSEPKYINAEEFIRKIGHDLELSSCMPEDWCRGVRFVLYRIKNEPAADVVEVVRCKDCKHWREYIESFPTCVVNRDVDGSEKQTKQMDFCSYGERKDG